MGKPIMGFCTADSANPPKLCVATDGSQKYSIVRGYLHSKTNFLICLHLVGTSGGAGRKGFKGHVHVWCNFGSGTKILRFINLHDRPFVLPLFSLLFSVTEIFSHKFKLLYEKHFKDLLDLDLF